MIMARHTTQLFAAAIAMTVAGIASAPAQQYPSQDIHVICGAPAGSGADIIVRYYAEKLRVATGRVVLVENKPGAQGNIATEYLARAKPDGYTIYLNGGSVLAANMHVFKNPPVDIVKQLQVVAGINKLATMLSVRPDAPWKNLGELTAFLKEKGDKASYGISNPVAQVAGAIYKEKTGIKAEQVAYKAASDSFNDLKSGAIDYAVYDPIYALAQVREGRLRVLAVSTKERIESHPELMTFTEQGVPMDLAGWWAVFVPAGTPRPVVDTLASLFNDIQKQPETNKFLNTYGSDAWIFTPEEGQARLTKDVKDWADYIKVGKIEPQG
jgi:tripartite-type tricarboxylate transporter receptor subunit TctC